MSDRGICNACRGRGTKWTGGPPPLPCRKCKGTGLVGANSERTNWRNPELERTPYR